MPSRIQQLALTALTCVLGVLLCLGGTASGVAVTSPEKIASGEFFSDPGFYVGAIGPQSPEPQWEINSVPTKTASGRRRWLSPDPLESVTGEMAEMLPEGSNLYAYVGNDPANFLDSDGLRIIQFDEDGNPLPPEPFKLEFNPPTSWADLWARLNPPKDPNMVCMTFNVPVGPSGVPKAVEAGKWIAKAPQAWAKLDAGAILKAAKQAGLGTGARSGQHGRPFTAAAAKLRELAKQSRKRGDLPEYWKTLLDKADDFCSKAKGINHK